MDRTERRGRSEIAQPKVGPKGERSESIFKILKIGQGGAGEERT